MTTLFDRELVPYEEAAAALGIEPKRLLGFMLRQRVDDPIGGQAEDGGIYVYGWSCKGLAARAADTDSGTSAEHSVSCQCTLCWERNGSVTLPTTPSTSVTDTGVRKDG